MPLTYTITLIFFATSRGDAQSRLEAYWSSFGTFIQQILRLDEEKQEQNTRKRALKSESLRLPSPRSCMTSLERDQLLSTTPEVSFEIIIALACSWSIVLYLYSCFRALSIDIVGAAA